MDENIEADVFEKVKEAQKKSNYKSKRKGDNSRQPSVDEENESKSSEESQNILKKMINYLDKLKKMEKKLKIQKQQDVYMIDSDVNEDVQKEKLVDENIGAEVFEEVKEAEKKSNYKSKRGRGNSRQPSVDKENESKSSEESQNDVKNMIKYLDKLKKMEKKLKIQKQQEVDDTIHSNVNKGKRKEDLAKEIEEISKLLANHDFKDSSVDIENRSKSTEEFQNTLKMMIMYLDKLKKMERKFKIKKQKEADSIGSEVSEKDGKENLGSGNIGADISGEVEETKEKSNNKSKTKGNKNFKVVEELFGKEILHSRAPKIKIRL